MFSMSFFITELKKRCNDNSISNESFVQDLFSTVIDTADVRGKNGDYLDLDKSRISRILSQKDDIPKAMRSSLKKYGIIDSVKDAFAVFCDDYFDENSLDSVALTIKKAIQDDSTIPNGSKERIIRQDLDAKSLLAESFIIAINTNNKATNLSSCTIWQKGINTINVVSGELFNFGFNNRSQQKNIIVVPVNTRFDTHITTNTENERHPLVSSETLHGQWINRFERSNHSISELNKRISNYLQLKGIKPINSALSKKRRSSRIPGRNYCNN